MLIAFIRDLRASLSGKDLPEDIKQRMLAMHEEAVQLKEELKTANDKLVKAKRVSREAVTDVFESLTLFPVHQRAG